MNDQSSPDLTAIPLKHFWWHQWALYAAHAFVWIGFCIAVVKAWSTGDWRLFAISLMMLGIGLGVFRGVAFFMNVWVIWAQYVSAREIREEADLREAGD